MDRSSAQVSMWTRLIEPHPVVTDLHFKRILALVAGWHLVTIPLGPLLAGLQVFFGEADRVSGLWLYVAPLMTFLNYLLARSRWGQQILWMQVWSTFGIVVAALFIAPDRAATSFALLLPVLAAALCFGLRHVMLLQGLALVVVVVNVSQSEVDERGSYIGVGVVLLASFAIIAAMVRHRTWLYDTTVRQLTEEATRARALMTAGFDGVADVLNGRLARVTDGFGAALGTSSSDLEGQRVEDVLHFAGPEEYSRQEAVPFLDREGALRYLAVVRQSLPGQDCCSEVIAVRDQTHEQLHKANLQFTDRMASIGTVASGVAHEVNNALMALSGHSEVGAVRLREGSLKEAESSFSAIADSAERISNCVRQLQRFGEGVDSKLEPIDLNDVVSSTVSLAQHQVRHVANLRVELTDELPPCQAVENWVGQVVMNLLLNALDALHGVPEATIRVSTHLEGDEIWVRVSDNGPGVPKELGSKIFQPFMTSKSDKGSGLGLSISASLASRMNGSLTLEPTEGGASFLLRLVRAPESVAVSEATLPAEPPKEDQRVLIVDDEPSVVAVIAQLLQPAHVEIASSVEEARTALKGRFDLVLSDIVMPKDSGLDLREWLRAEHPHMLPRLVLMTGSALGNHDGLQALPSSQKVLYKPIDKELLWAVLSGMPPSEPAPSRR